MAVAEHNVGRTKTERAAGRIMCHAAQRQDSLQFRHRLDLGLQKGAAGIHFGPDWFVLGGQAADDIGDTRAMQADVVIAIFLIGAACQIKPAKHVEKIAAGGITGKWTTGAICPAPTRRKADHQKPCVQRSESRDRGIVPVRFGCAAFPPQ